MSSRSTDQKITMAAFPPIHSSYFQTFSGNLIYSITLLDQTSFTMETILFIQIFSIAL